MFPEDCFSKHSGTLNCSGGFSDGLTGLRVIRKKEVLFKAGLMVLIAEKEEGALSPSGFCVMPS